MEEIRTERGGNRIDGDAREAGSVLATWLDATLNTIETAANGWFDVLDEMRGMVSGRVRQTLDWAEGFPKASFAMARTVTNACDGVMAQSIRASDRCTQSVLHAVRRFGDTARGFVSTTASSLVGGEQRNATTNGAPRVAAAE